MFILTVNGKERQYQDSLPENLTALLKELNIEAATIVAEIDGKIIKRDDFDNTTVTENQKIELIRFIGGG